VPLVLVSSYIQAGTVFRSNMSVSYDHTSILATLRDWIGISSSDMLPSARIAAAPNLAQVLTLSQPRTDIPTVPGPVRDPPPASLSLPPNPVQQSLVSGAAYRFGEDTAAAVVQAKTCQHAIDFFRSHASRAHS